MKVKQWTRLICVSVEVFALALGYGQAAASCAAIVVVISYCVTNSHELVDHRPRENPADLGPKKLALLLLELLRMALYLSMAALLVVGVKKRRPGYVLAYFVFGIVIVGLAINEMVMILLTSNDRIKKSSIVMFLATFMYSLCLVPIYRAYRKIMQKEDSTDMPYIILQEQFASDIKEDFF